MNLNHINIPVKDVEQSKQFFEKYFDFTCTEVKGDHIIAVLKGKDDFTLVLMSDSFNKNDVSSFPSTFHIGFLVQSRDEVIAKYKKLKEEDGFIIENEPANMQGVFGFYFMAPGNILVEVSSSEPK